MSQLPPAVATSSRSVARSAVRAAARSATHAAPLAPAAPLVSASPAPTADPAAALAASLAIQKELEEKVRGLEIRLAQIEASMIDTNPTPGPGRGHGRNPLHAVSHI